jgi:hypothetical protein
MISSLTLWDSLGSIPDPRKASGRRYSLQSLLALIIAAMLCGKLSLRAIARWGRRLTVEQLKSIGIERPTSPSQATLHNLLVRLETNCVELAIGKWFQSLMGQMQHQIAIDGKSLKSSASQEYPALHLLSAYCVPVECVLYQLAVDVKENEITAANKLLFHIPIQGNIITGDAIFCQRQLCNEIKEKSGEYLFTVKGNQKTLQKNIQRIFSPEG